MNTVLLSKVEKQFLREDLPEFSVGDTIKLYTKIIEGEKQRIQMFEGIVIAMHGSGTRKTFTIRRISNGIGVEKIVPIHSPSIAKIDVLKKGRVRHAKIYYMRERIGKKAMFVKSQA